MFPLIFVPKNILCQKSWFLHLHFESFFKKVQTNFSTKGKKANDMFWYFFCFLIINTSKGVNGERRYRAASAARQKNKFCPNVQTTLAPLPKISWKLNEATPKFMISLDPAVPPTPLWCHQWSWSARWCLVAKFTQIHLSIFFQRWRGSGLSGGLQRTRVLVDSFRLSLGGLILCSVQFVYRTSGNDAVHEAGLNWSNSIRVSKILSNLIKLLYITNFTKSKNP